MTKLFIVYKDKSKITITHSGSGQYDMSGQIEKYGWRRTAIAKMWVQHYPKNKFEPIIIVDSEKEGVKL